MFSCYLPSLLLQNLLLRGSFPFHSKNKTFIKDILDTKISHELILSPKILETDNWNAKASCRVLITFPNIFLKIPENIALMSSNARKWPKQLLKICSYIQFHPCSSGVWRFFFDNSCFMIIWSARLGTVYLHARDIFRIHITILISVDMPTIITGIYLWG